MSIYDLITAAEAAMSAEAADKEATRQEHRDSVMGSFLYCLKVWWFTLADDIPLPEPDGLGMLDSPGAVSLHWTTTWQGVHLRINSGEAPYNCQKSSLRSEPHLALEVENVNGMGRDWSEIVPFPAMQAKDGNAYPWAVLPAGQGEARWSAYHRKLGDAFAQARAAVALREEASRTRRELERKQRVQHWVYTLGNASSHGALAEIMAAASRECPDDTDAFVGPAREALKRLLEQQDEIDRRKREADADEAERERLMQQLAADWQSFHYYEIHYALQAGDEPAMAVTYTTTAYPDAEGWWGELNYGKVRRVHFEYVAKVIQHLCDHPANAPGCLLRSCTAESKLRPGVTVPWWLPPVGDNFWWLKRAGEDMTGITLQD